LYIYVYSWNKQCPWGTHCCCYSLVTVYGAYISSFCVGSSVFLS
jgi:hypothetical protein